MQFQPVFLFSLIYQQCLLLAEEFERKNPAECSTNKTVHINIQGKKARKREQMFCT